MGCGEIRRNSKYCFDKGSVYRKRRIQYDVKCDFREAGIPGKFISQVQFYAPLSFNADEYLYDTAFGVVRQPEIEDDRPGLSFICAKTDAGAGAVLCANGKYGYRGFKSSLTVNLIRSGYEPDPTPEYGMHDIKFTLISVGCDTDSRLIHLSRRIQSPLSVINIRPSAGKLPPSASFLQISGDAVISSVKKHEDKDEVVIRLYEAEGAEKRITVSALKEIKSAYFTDINEKFDLGALIFENNTVKLILKPYQITTIPYA